MFKNIKKIDMVRNENSNKSSDVSPEIKSTEELNIYDNSQNVGNIQKVSIMTTDKTNLKSDKNIAPEITHKKSKERKKELNALKEIVKIKIRLKNTKIIKDNEPNIFSSRTLERNNQDIAQLHENTSQGTSALKFIKTISENSENLSDESYNEVFKLITGMLPAEYKKLSKKEQIKNLDLTNLANFLASRDITETQQQTIIKKMLQDYSENLMAMPDYGAVKQLLNDTIVNFFGGVTTKDLQNQSNKKLNELIELKNSKINSAKFVEKYKQITGVTFNTAKIRHAMNLSEIHKFAEIYYEKLDIIQDKSLQNILSDYEKHPKIVIGTDGQYLCDSVTPMIKASINTTGKLLNISDNEAEKLLSDSFEKAIGKNFSEATDTEKQEFFYQNLKIITAKEQAETIREYLEKLGAKDKVNYHLSYKNAIEEAFGKDILAEMIENNRVWTEYSYQGVKIGTIIGMSMLTGGTAGIAGLTGLSASSVVAAGVGSASLGLDLCEYSTDSQGLTKEEFKEAGINASKTTVYTFMGMQANQIGLNVLSHSEKLQKIAQSSHALPKSASTFTKTNATILGKIPKYGPKILGETSEFLTDTTSSYIFTKTLGDETSLLQESLESGIPQLGQVFLQHGFGSLAGRIAHRTQQKIQQTDKTEIAKTSYVNKGKGSTGFKSAKDTTVKIPFTEGGKRKAIERLLDNSDFKNIKEFKEELMQLAKDNQNFVRISKMLNLSENYLKNLHYIDIENNLKLDNENFDKLLKCIDKFKLKNNSEANRLLQLNDNSLSRLIELIEINKRLYNEKYTIDTFTNVAEYPNENYETLKKLMNNFPDKNFETLQNVALLDKNSFKEAISVMRNQNSDFKTIDEYFQFKKFEKSFPDLEYKDGKINLSVLNLPQADKKLYSYAFEIGNTRNLSAKEMYSLKTALKNSECPYLENIVSIMSSQEFRLLNNEEILTMANYLKQEYIEINLASIKENLKTKENFITELRENGILKGLVKDPSMMSKILDNITKDNIDLLDNLYKVKDFPKEHIFSILTSAQTPEQVKLAQELCMDKDFPREHISSILTSAQTPEQINMAKELCMDKDFPKEHISSILASAQTPEKINWAKELCMDKDFPREHISSILAYAKTPEKINWAKELCMDKDFPKEHISSILAYAQTSEQIKLAKELCRDKDFPKCAIAPFVCDDNITQTTCNELPGYMKQKIDILKIINKSDIQNKTDICIMFAPLNMDTNYFRKKLETFGQINNIISMLPENSENQGIKKIKEYFENYKTSIIKTMTETTKPVEVPQEAKTNFFKHMAFCNDDSKNAIINFDCSKYAKSGLPLQYSREKFVSDLKDYLQTLPSKQQSDILGKLEISLCDKGYDGYDGLLNISNLSENNPIEVKVKELAENFLLKNHIQTGDEKLDEALNSITSGLPEFYNIIGKKQHSQHQYTLDIHTIKVLQEAIKNPKYDNLSNMDKLNLQMVIILHDLSKQEGLDDAQHEIMSGRYCNDILKKFNLPQNQKDRITEIVKWHNWGELYGTTPYGYDYAIDDKALASIFNHPGDIEIAEIFAKSDLLGVNQEFHDAHINGLEEKVSNIKKQIQEIYKTGNLLYPTRILSSSKIPTQKYNGHIYKVIDLTQISDEFDLHQWGLSVEKKSDLRLLVHCGNPEFVKSLSNINNESYLCSSLISQKENHTFENISTGMVIEAEHCNIIHTSYDNLGSNSKFGEFTTKRKVIINNIYYKPTPRIYQSNNMIKYLQQRGYAIQPDDYNKIYEELLNTKYKNQIHDVVVNGISIKKEDLINAYNYAENNLITRENDTGHWTELNVYNSKIKGIFSKSASIEEVPEYMLKFARENNLPIYILGRSHF